MKPLRFKGRNPALYPGNKPFGAGSSVASSEDSPQELNSFPNLLLGGSQRNRGWEAWWRISHNTLDGNSCHSFGYRIGKAEIIPEACGLEEANRLICQGPGI